MALNPIINPSSISHHWYDPYINGTYHPWCSYHPRVDPVRRGPSRFLLPVSVTAVVRMPGMSFGAVVSKFGWGPRLSHRKIWENHGKTIGKWRFKPPKWWVEWDLYSWLMIAKLVNITPTTLVYETQITNGSWMLLGFINQLSYLGDPTL